MSNFEVDHHEYTAADHNAVTRTKSLGDMEFVEILIRDIDGKPYYEIHYIENGEHHIGYARCAKKASKFPNETVKARKAAMIEYISKQAIINYIKERQCKTCSDIGLCGNCAVLTAINLIKNYPGATLTPAHAESCSTCAKNADNNGVYEDGRTKCPIQEHYALLKNGYCHLYSPLGMSESEESGNV